MMYKIQHGLVYIHLSKDTQLPRTHCATTNGTTLLSMSTPSL